MKMSLNKLIIILALLLSGSVFAQINDSLQIKMNYINTSPQNAEVYLNSSLIGSTPLRFFNDIIDTVNKNTILLRLKSYNDFLFTFDRAEVPIYKNIALLPLKNFTANNDLVRKNGSNLFKTPRKVVPLVLTGGVSLGSAFFSFYFKRLANDRYNEYLNTGDRDKLNLTKKYDIYSGVALGILQVAFVSFLYYLLFE